MKYLFQLRLPAFVDSALSFGAKFQRRENELLEIAKSGRSRMLIREELKARIKIVDTACLIYLALAILFTINSGEVSPLFGQLSYLMTLLFFGYWRIWIDSKILDTVEELPISGEADSSKLDIWIKNRANYLKYFILLYFLSALNF
jgi:hypothetical protein